MMESVWGPVTDSTEQSEFENHFEPFQPLPDRDEYICRLESKLKRIKGNGREPSSKDILKCLGVAKGDHLSNFSINGQQQTNGGNDVDFDCKPDDAGSLLTSLESKLFPNRLIPNPEELEKLLQHDILAILTDRAANHESREKSQDDQM